jgi:hypothetical protein
MAAATLKELLLKQKIKGAERKGVSAAKKAGKSKAVAKTFAMTAKREQLRADILGLVLTWEDKNPLGDDGCSGLPKATSHNPSPLVREGVEAAFQDVGYRKWLIEQEFTWEIDVELHYSLPFSKTKSQKIDPIYFVQRGMMKDPVGDLGAINRRIESAVMYSRLVNNHRPDGDKNKGVFQVAKYRITCVGL